MEPHPLPSDMFLMYFSEREQTLDEYLITIPTVPAVDIDEVQTIVTEDSEGLIVCYGERVPFLSGIFFAPVSNVSFEKSERNIFVRIAKSSPLIWPCLFKQNIEGVPVDPMSLFEYLQTLPNSLENKKLIESILYQLYEMCYPPIVMSVCKEKPEAGSAIQKLVYLIDECGWTGDLKDVYEIATHGVLPVETALNIFAKSELTDNVMRYAYGQLLERAGDIQQAITVYQLAEDYPMAVMRISQLMDDTVEEPPMIESSSRNPRRIALYIVGGISSLVLIGSMIYRHFRKK